jgi:cell division protein FtsW
MSEKSAHILIFTVVSLIVLGVVMLLSTSVFAGEHPADMYFDIRRQVAWLGVGIIVCVAFVMIDYHFWQRTAWVWFGVTCVLLALCYVPFFAETRNGAARWLSGKSFGLSVLRIQPSELAKLATVFVIAAWMAKYAENVKEFRKGFLYPLLIAIIPVALIAGEVDIGSASLVLACSILVIFIAGVKLRYFITIGAISVAGIVSAILLIPNRYERLMAFMDVEKYQEGFGMQQWRGLLAMGSGGFWGLGLGQGREKMMHLPYAHTDFIFTMVGEELGLIATLLVVFAFVLIIVSGSLISMHAPDRFGKMIGFGAVCIIVLQALINIGVTTVLLPNKGLPLPFVSYGGSNLLLCLMCIGLLLNIYRQGVEPEKELKAQLPRRRLTPRV